MLIPVKNMQGENVGEVELLPEIFEAPVNISLMHQALVRQLSNARLGTHKAKTRSENNRTKAKWYRQKGTGRARHGSRNAPNFVGGGIAHGPLPRSYNNQMPKKMRRAALRSALSVKAAAEQVLILDALTMDAPKTKQMLNVLRSLETIVGKTLIVLPEDNNNVELSVRNLQRAKTLRAQYLNIRDLLNADFLVMPMDSLKVIEGILGDASRKSEE
ncbi:MAG: 50S ribosomal protein L4 [Anaerolineales bacterium]|nr:MAG: 50S ribosomal protein L4 [Anaerolineales bacterium]